MEGEGYSGKWIKNVNKQGLLSFKKYNRGNTLILIHRPLWGNLALILRLSWNKTSISYSAKEIPEELIELEFQKN